MICQLYKFYNTVFNVINRYNIYKQTLPNRRPAKPEVHVRTDQLSVAS